MDKTGILYKEWQALQPLSGCKRYLLSQRFTVDYNYNSNHIEGNTLTYGQTELLLLFGKVSRKGDLKDFNDMKASLVGLKMMKEEARTSDMPLTETVYPAAPSDVASRRLHGLPSSSRRRSNQ